MIVSSNSPVQALGPKWKLKKIGPSDTTENARNRPSATRLSAKRHTSVTPESVKSHANVPLSNAKKITSATAKSASKGRCSRLETAESVHRVGVFVAQFTGNGLVGHQSAAHIEPVAQMWVIG